jgi:hypothetical protein
MRFPFGYRFGRRLHGGAIGRNMRVSAKNFRGLA